MACYGDGNNLGKLYSPSFEIVAEDGGVGWGDWGDALDDALHPAGPRPRPDVVIDDPNPQTIYTPGGPGPDVTMEPGDDMPTVHLGLQYGEGAPKVPGWALLAAIPLLFLFARR